MGSFHAMPRALWVIRDTSHAPPSPVFYMLRFRIPGSVFSRPCL